MASEEDPAISEIRINSMPLLFCHAVLHALCLASTGADTDTSSSSRLALLPFWGDILSAKTFNDKILYRTGLDRSSWIRCVEVVKKATSK